ncbi:MAG: hypothetical protein PWR26_1248 [Methanosarcinales archaeon]|nr:hypothetical protein [Methanosarcinales archaeon]
MIEERRPKIIRMSPIIRECEKRGTDYFRVAPLPCTGVLRWVVVACTKKSVFTVHVCFD